MSEPQPRFTFLLGSGISCVAGLPNVQMLSCAVASSVSGAEARLLEVIKLLSAATHGDGRDSYEDWYFVADQIAQHEGGNFENPGLLPLMEHLRCTLDVINDGVMATAENLCVAIETTIRRELRVKDPKPDVAFSGLVEAIRRDAGTTFRFFSLNHDLLLESFLKKNGIDPYRCLVPHSENSAYDKVRFSQQAFNAAAVSVIKLHGSLEWRRYRPKSARKASDPFRGEFVGVRNAEDEKFESMDENPRTLTGTLNKMLQYSSPIFLPMFAQFHQCLRDSNRLVVCGFGFGDKGINSLLIDWMSSEVAPRLVVIDPHPFHPSRCRPAVLEKVEMWQDDGRLEVIRRCVSVNDMTWTEILQIADVG
jgi:hypothetical protein